MTTRDSSDLSPSEARTLFEELLRPRNEGRWLQDGLRDLGPQAIQGMRSLDWVLSTRHRWSTASLVRIFCLAFHLPDDHALVARLRNRLNSQKRSEDWIDRGEPGPSSSMPLPGFHPTAGANQEQSTHAPVVAESGVHLSPWQRWRRYVVRRLSRARLLWSRGGLLAVLLLAIGLGLSRPIRLPDGTPLISPDAPPISDCMGTFAEGCEPCSSSCTLVGSWDCLQEICPPSPPEPSPSPSPPPPAPPPPLPPPPSSQLAIAVQLLGLDPDHIRLAPVIALGLVFLFMLAVYLVSHYGYLWARRRKIVWSGPYLFRSQSIGGVEPPRLEDGALQQLRLVLTASEPWSKPLPDLPDIDFESSVEGTIRRAGLLWIRHLPAPPDTCALWLLQDTHRRSLPRRRSLAEEIADHLQCWDLPIRWWRYHQWPRTLHEVGSGERCRIEQLIASPSPPCLILGDSRGIDRRRRDQRRILEKLAQLPRVLWVEPSGSPLDTADVMYLQGLGFEVCSGESSSLLPACRRVFTGRQHFMPQRFEERHNGRSTGTLSPRHWTLNTFEVYADDGLFAFAQACAVMPPPFSVALAEALRKEFFQHLPVEHLNHLLEVPGTRSSAAGLSFSPSARSLLLSRMQDTWSSVRRQEIVDYLLQQADDIEPPHRKGNKRSLQYLRWEQCRLQIQLHKNPDKAIHGLDRLRGTPLQGPSESVLSRIVPEQPTGAALEAASEPGLPLLAKPKLASTTGILRRYSNKLPKALRGRGLGWKWMVGLTVACAAILALGYLLQERGWGWGPRTAIRLPENCPGTDCIYRLETLQIDPSGEELWKTVMVSQSLPTDPQPVAPGKTFRLVVLTEGSFVISQSVISEEGNVLNLSLSKAEKPTLECKPQIPGIELCRHRNNEDALGTGSRSWRASVQQQLEEEQRSSASLDATFLSLGVELNSESIETPGLSTTASYLFERRSIDYLLRISPTTANETSANVGPWPDVQQYLRDFSPVLNSQVLWWTAPSPNGGQVPESVRLHVEAFAKRAKTSAHLALGSTDPGSLREALEPPNSGDQQLLVGAEIIQYLPNAVVQGEPILIRRPIFIPPQPCPLSIDLQDETEGPQPIRIDGVSYTLSQARELRLQPGDHPVEVRWALHRQPWRDKVRCNAGQAAVISPRPGDCQLTVQAAASNDRLPTSIRLLSSEEPLQLQLNIETTVPCQQDLQLATRWDNRLDPLTTRHTCSEFPCKVTLSYLMCELRVRFPSGVTFEPEPTLSWSRPGSTNTTSFGAQGTARIDLLQETPEKIDITLQRDHRLQAEAWKKTVDCKDGEVVVDFDVTLRKAEWEIKSGVLGVAAHPLDDSLLVVTPEQLLVRGRLDMQRQDIAHGVAGASRVLRSRGTGNTLAIVGQKGQLGLFERRTSVWSSVQVEAMSRDINDIDFYGKTESLLVAAEAEGLIYLERNSGGSYKRLSKSARHGGDMLRLSVSPDGSALIFEDNRSGLKARNITRLDTGNSLPEVNLPDVENSNKWICSLPDGYFVSASDKKGFLFKANSSTPVQPLQAVSRRKPIELLACSPTDRLVVIARENGKLEAWSLSGVGQSERLLRPLQSNSRDGVIHSGVTSITFADNGKEIITGGGKLVRFWRLDTSTSSNSGSQ